MMIKESLFAAHEREEKLNQARDIIQLFDLSDEQMGLYCSLCSSDYCLKKFN